MFANFYPDSTPEEAEEFSAAVDGGEVRQIEIFLTQDQIMNWIKKS